MSFWLPPPGPPPGPPPPGHPPGPPPLLPDDAGVLKAATSVPPLYSACQVLAVHDDADLHVPPLMLTPFSKSPTAMMVPPVI